MGGPTLTVFHNSFLTLKSSALGRLVTDATNPTQDFWPEMDPQLRDNEVEVRPFESLRRAAVSGSNAGLCAKLTRLFSAGLSGENMFDELNTTALRRYALLQPRRHFQAMCMDDETRLWIEEALRDCPIFLVVGLVTVTEAAVQHGRQQSMKASAASIEVPVAGAGATTAAGPGNAASLDLCGSITRSSNGSLRFVASGERVIGVQYRKLKFRLFQKRTLDTAFLENNPNRWELFLGTDRAGNKDVLEADLQDSLTTEELEWDADVEEELAIFEDS